MGNGTSQPPKKYSGNVPGNRDHIVHEGDFLQTYKGGGTETISMGTGVPAMSIGVKILQSVDTGFDENDRKYGPGEYYVIKPNGKRVYLTKGGDYKAQVATLVTMGKAYGAGPAVIVGGPVGAPTYTVFSSTSTSPGSDYTPMQITNVGDWQKAVWYGHEKDTKGKYANLYGSAAINPFKSRPRNTFSTLADIGRTTLMIVDAVAVPVLEFGLDAVTDDLAGTLMQITGLDDVLQKNLDTLTDLHGVEFTPSGKQTAGYFVNLAKDPRLDAQFSKMMKISRAKAFGEAGKTNKYQKEFQKLVNHTNYSNNDKMIAMGKLQNQNYRFDAQSQIDVLTKTVKMLRKLVPNPPNWNWDLTEIGLTNPDPAYQIRFAMHTTENLMKKVVPYMKQQATDQHQKSTGSTVLTPPKKAPDPATKVGSGFINGAKVRNHHPTRIKGFIPSLEPILGF